MLRQETGGVISCAFWPIHCCFFDIFLVQLKYNGKVDREFWTQECQYLCVRTLYKHREASLINCGISSTNPDILLISPGHHQQTIGIGLGNEA